MKFTYRLISADGGWLAECVETDAAGEGATEDAAVASLRKAIEERMFRPDAIAPPSSPTRAAIELTPASEREKEEHMLDAGGPGEVAVPSS